MSRRSIRKGLLIRFFASKWDEIGEFSPEKSHARRFEELLELQEESVELDDDLDHLEEQVEEV